MYFFANSKSKQILIRNGTQLLVDFEDLKVLPALMIDIHSVLVDICKIVPQVKKGYRPTMFGFYPVALAIETGITLLTFQGIAEIYINNGILLPKLF